MFKFWLHVMYGLLVSVAVLVMAYHWPVLGLGVITAVIFLFARRHYDNKWLVIAATMAVVFIWGLEQDIMHSGLIPKMTQQVIDLFNLVRTNFFSK